MGGERKGVSYEKAIAAVQEMMDPSAQVQHNQKLKDHHGHWRQFDVVIRANAAGRQLLGIIECKDLKRRVGTPDVDAFVTKARGVNANLTLLASRRGFTKPALEKAKRYGIGTISLLPDDPNDAGFSVGTRAYAEIYSWTTRSLLLHFVRKTAPKISAGAESVMWKGHRIIDWFDKQLVTAYAGSEEEGWHSTKVQFSKVRRLTIGESGWMVRGVIFRGFRVCTKKTKWIRVKGPAFYDWNLQQMTVPPGGEIRTASWESDFSDWEDYEGDIPPQTGPLDFRFKGYLLYADPHMETIDLTEL